MPEPAALALTHSHRRTQPHASHARLQQPGGRLKQLTCSLQDRRSCSSQHCRQLQQAGHLSTALMGWGPVAAKTTLKRRTTLALFMSL